MTGADSLDTTNTNSDTASFDSSLTSLEWGNSSEEGIALIPKDHTTAAVDAEIGTPPQPRTAPKAVLTVTKLFAIMFIACIGGAYGIEDAVAAIGPLFSLILIVTLPWLLQFPLALLTAELASSLPSNSGMIQWINTSFGRYSRFGTMEIILISVFINTTDNAIYPALFCDYLSNMVPDLNAGWVFLIKTLVVVFSVSLNIVGVDFVGGFALFLTVLVLSPFVLLTIFAIPTLQPQNWLIVPPASAIEWGVLISVMFWNLNGVDGAGNISEEVKDRKSYFRATIALVLATIGCYLLPVAAGLSVSPNYADWSAGYFVEICRNVGPPWVRAFLPWMMLICGMISSLGYIVTLLCTTSRVLHGVAELNFIPLLCKPFTRLHSKFKTPDTCIMLNGFVTLILSLFFDFEELVAVSTSLYSTRLFLEFGALILMRIRFPDLYRPIKIPFGLKGLFAIATFPCLYSLVCVFLGLTLSLKAFLLTLGIILPTVLSGVLFQIFYKGEMPVHPAVLNCRRARSPIEEENVEEGV